MQEMCSIIENSLVMLHTVTHSTYSIVTYLTNFFDVPLMWFLVMQNNKICLKSNPFIRYIKECCCDNYLSKRHSTEIYLRSSDKYLKLCELDMIWSDFTNMNVMLSGSLTDRDAAAQTFCSGGMVETERRPQMNSNPLYGGERFQGNAASGQKVSFCAVALISQRCSAVNKIQLSGSFIQQPPWSAIV